MKIYPAFDLGQECNYHSFVTSIEQLLEALLPPEILPLQSHPERFLHALSPLLPLISFAQLKPQGNAFRITVLSHAEYTHGTGRFLSDALSRRFIPGKIVELVGTRTLSFHFFPHPKREFLFNERWIMANHKEEIPLIQEKLPRFIEELRLTLLCIVRARHFLSLKAPPDSPILPEIQHLSTFEEVQQIVSRLTAEKTLGEIRQYIAPFTQRRPKIFDRDIFEEMKPFLTLCGEKFIGTRPRKEIVRLICTQFYFQKQLNALRKSAPLTRHLLFKTFRSPTKTGLLILFSRFTEQELLKKEHLLTALTHCVPCAQEIPDSFLIDPTPTHILLYIEIAPIPTQVNALLRAKLPSALLRSIQRTAHPLFMLRNEEDHLRALAALTKELRHRRDPPQIVLLFEEQTDDALLFSVIMARFLTPTTPPLKALLATFPLPTSLREHKTIRNRYPKEVSIFRAHLPKQDYLRKDASLDLPRARQTLLSHLDTAFHGVRDYNGGLLAQQLASLHTLQQLLGAAFEHNAFLLENFFFSIEPLSSQMTLSTAHLRDGFELLLQLIESTICHHIGAHTGGCVLAAHDKPHLLAFLDATRDQSPGTAYSLTHLPDHIACILFFAHPEVGSSFRVFVERVLK